MLGVYIVVGLQLRVAIKSGSTQNTHSDCRLGALFFIILIQEFGVLSGFELFISARPLFMYVSIATVNTYTQPAYIN